MRPGSNGRLSNFGPGTRMPAGYQVTSGFWSLPVNIVFEEDVAAALRDGVTI